MDMLILSAALLIFIGSLYFVTNKIKTSEKKIAEEKFPIEQKSFNNLSKKNDFKTEILKLKERIEELQNFISRLKTKTTLLEKINTELENEKQKLLLQIKKMEDIQRQKDEYCEIFLHDIKNPAGVIKGLAELLENYELTFADQKELIFTLIKTSERMMKLTEDITKAMNMETADYQLELKNTLIEGVITESYLFNIVKARRKGIEIKLNIDPNLPRVELDENKMAEVLDNLLDNAIKFSNKGTIIKLNVFQESNYIRIEIIDQGPGLSEKEITMAFNKKSKLSSKPTAGEASTGLGLWIVKKIIEKHCGHVWITSQVGKGSNFSFKIPISQGIG